MKVGRVNEHNRSEVLELIFSHMSVKELESFKINNAQSYAEVLDRINNKHGACFVAEIDGSVIGYLLADGKQNSGSIKYAELCDMRVKDNYQRQGVGSLLVEQFIQWAKDEGYERLSVDVYALSEKNIGFYQKHGFLPKTLTMERWFS